jgi:hypothetical protein
MARKETPSGGLKKKIEAKLVFMSVANSSLIFWLAL